SEGNLLDGGAATSSLGGIETGRTHGDDLDRIGRLHGGNDVAGVDRALKSVSRHHFGDFRNLRYIEQCGSARQILLTVRGGGSEDVFVAPAHFGNQQTHVLGQLMGVDSVVSDQHLADTGDFGGS